MKNKIVYIYINQYFKNKHEKSFVFLIRQNFQSFFRGPIGAHSTPPPPPPPPPSKKKKEAQL